MKCRTCGADIRLTDKVCPYCGRILNETAGYRADEEKYIKENEKTKKKIREILAENIPMVISAVVMVVLLIAVGIAFYVEDNAYHFREDARRKESVKKVDEYRAEILKYLDAGDHTGFAAFMEYHNIAEWEAPYDDLNLLWDLTEEYESLVSAVEASVIFGPEARRYRPEQDVHDCYRAIFDFYHEFEYNQSDIDADPYKEYMYDMKDKADIILELYLGLDESGREEYFAGSELKQRAYLEEVLIHE